LTFFKISIVGKLEQKDTLYAHSLGPISLFVETDFETEKKSTLGSNPTKP